MARADVRPDIKERVLGHTIKGVEGSTTGTTTMLRRPRRSRRSAGVIFTIVNGVPEEPKEVKPSVWGVTVKKQARTTRP